MLVARDIHSLASDPRIAARGCAVTLGNFDGVHLGHRALLRKTLSTARKLDLCAAAVTFDPHPLRLLRGDNAPPQLISPQGKLDCFAQLGLDAALVLPFTRELAAMQPEAFVRAVLLEAMHTRALVVGYDYAFGRDRRGNAALLNELGRRYGFCVEEAPALLKGEEPVSSTRIRTLLREGDVAGAARLLGRHYSAEGIVVHGKARGGSLLGFPTANLSPDAGILLPRHGVYAVTVEIGSRAEKQTGATNFPQPGEGGCLPFSDSARKNAATSSGHILRGVANVGVNPTFGDGFARVEAHILHFNGDLYGVPLKVYFLQRIRDERKFASVDELAARIRQDVRQAEAACGPGPD
ncbi:MAG: bifunctional riboflavin kinase/FAD synthetase [Desulfovibrio sp.]|nr:bifunctional riboflavin kinase/FAD synthetase [Desulfovibrio sp.]